MAAARGRRGLLGAAEAVERCVDLGPRAGGGEPRPRSCWISRYTSLRNTGMSRGAWIPIRTFSPMIESTDTSMSSPIMML